MKAIAKIVLNLHRLNPRFRGSSKLLVSSLCLGLLATLSTNAGAQTSIEPFRPFSPGAATTSNVNQRLVGEWQTKNPLSGKPVKLIFTPENKFFFLFSESGTPVALPLGYRVNSGAYPMQLDITFPGEEQVVETIFEFTSDASLRLELGDVNPKAPRPTAFTSKAIVLQKISNATSLPANTRIFIAERETFKAGESEGKTAITVMNQLQQAYYAKNRQFAPTIEQLVQRGMGIKPETENYRYRIVPQGDGTQSVMMTASALRPGLKSYTGAVFAIPSKGKKTLMAGICESNNPSATPSAIPSLAKKGRIIQCPSGSHRL